MGCAVASSLAESKAVFAVFASVAMALSAETSAAGGFGPTVLGEGFQRDIRQHRTSKASVLSFCPGMVLSMSCCVRQYSDLLTRDQRWRIDRAGRPLVP